MSSESSTRESLLVFSDVHLGSDLNDCTSNVVRRSASIDRDLVQLLAHYRGVKPDGERWRLVVAGDFIDFIGMAISPERATVETACTEEEREHGLGNAADHARMKLRRVADRHADVLDELARFVADGHALTLVHGNHDIEFHWEGVQQDFRAMLVERALARAPALDPVQVADRIEFSPWFFYREGVVYIEHGHQYDEYCSTEHVMAPLSPLDPRRLARGFTDVLLRHVVRVTRGMREHGHEHVGVAHYLVFGAKLGLRGLFRLASDFASAVAELFRLRRAHLSEAARALHAEHERRVALLGEATRIGVDRLRALLSLQSPPVTRSIRGILASVLLDRLALAMIAVIAIIALSVIGLYSGHALWGAAGVLGAWGVMHRRLARQRQLDPTEHLVERAGRLSRLFPAAFVVMGHTHVPTVTPAGDATYINVGAWAEDEEAELPAGTAPRAPRTHLVIRVRGDRPEAELLAWTGAEARPFRSS